jgi:uncharacterized protein YfbU (UPF0304 family)
MEMTDIERIILINQYKLLKQQVPEDKSYHERCLRILTEGIEYEFDHLKTWFDNESITEAIGKETEDILYMFSHIRNCIESLDSDTISKNNFNDFGFIGFDKRTQLQYFKCASYLIDYAEHFSEDFAKFDKKQLDSHNYSVLTAYRNLLSEYNELMKSNTQLTEKELKHLFDIYTFKAN